MFFFLKGLPGTKIGKKEKGERCKREEYGKADQL
jgi:hypothetical protein